MADPMGTTGNPSRITLMTLLFTIVALVHVAGLFLMLLAVRRAPVAVESNRGFMVISEPSETHGSVGALVRTA